jgi:(p)ppGpp synthase/HD superfamily hydrolase
MNRSSGPTGLIVSNWSVLQDLSTILEAAHFAAQKHAAQRRKGAAGEPYVNHLLEVAQLVASAISEPDPNLVIAALLHDTVEDVGVSEDDLIQKYGPDVASLVMEVTDDKSLPKQERKRLQIEHAPKLTARAQVIKLADKISNLRAILISPPVDWSEQRRREYFIWAKQVAGALSHPNPILLSEFARTVALFENPIPAH